MGFSKIGDWALANRVLVTAGKKMEKAIKKTLLQEAHLYRKEMVQGLRTGAPGGKKFQKLARSTILSRRFKKVGGTKPLIRTGDLRNSITVIERSGNVFVGVPRSAKGKDGRSLVNIARVHEFGSKPIVIRITPKMRRLLAAMFRSTGKKSGEYGGGESGGGAVMVIQIPARPFMRPVELKLRKGRKKRVEARMRKNLGGALGGK